MALLDKALLTVVRLLCPTTSSRGRRRRINDNSKENKTGSGGAPDPVEFLRDNWNPTSRRKARRGRIRSDENPE